MHKLSLFVGGSRFRPAVLRDCFVHNLPAYDNPQGYVREFSDIFLTHVSMITKEHSYTCHRFHFAVLTNTKLRTKFTIIFGS